MRRGVEGRGRKVENDVIVKTAGGGDRDMLTIVKDVVESNGRWATVPLTATGLRVVGRE